MRKDFTGENVIQVIQREIDYLLTENNIQPPQINKIMVMNQTQCGLEYAVVQRLLFPIEDYVREVIIL